ncbi:D-aspartate oxidase-like [Elysia marginata]|uniref:D-aspartate oxidase-like n=1 Tax=Elysia marginata TaxID=1093978 RepID=A0AAV4GI10_9GAST|nr:D-aspartate oxidase-like [Elysia marginata]
MELHVGVVGAGIVGLSAAINIQKLIKHVKVTIVADNFGVDTLKEDQMGIFLPVPSRVKGVDTVQVREWLIDGYKHHSALATSLQGLESGQEFMPGVCFYTETSGQQNVPLPDLVRNFHVLTEEEKATLNYNWEHVCYFDTVVVDQIRYVRWLMKEFRETGGAIVFRTVNALQELYGMYDVVVNCTGRRTREMTVDPFFTFYSSRTVQLYGMYDVVVNCTGRRTREMTVDPFFTFYSSRTVQVERQLHKKFVLDDHLCMLPHLDCDRWDLSWTREPRETDVIVNDTNARFLLHLAKAKIPQLEGCEYVTEWEEQHRTRDPPLVEIEMINCVGGKGPILPVVHNVGHGPDAITLAWGTGAQTAHLVQDCQRLVKPYVPIWRPFDPTS